MNRVASRALAVLILVLVLTAGLGFFLAEYFAKSSQWVSFPANPHIYNGGNLGCGQVYDRSGQLLLDMTNGWKYADDEVLRKSTLHWLGDTDGYIQASALPHYSDYITGYDLWNGLYTYGGIGGKMTLTISAQVQKTALEALDGRKGTVAVYNYKTGEILCAVTGPTYDPLDKPDIEGDTTGAYTGAYVNRFIMSTYTPGSIFKLVTAAAALETVDNIDSLTFECTGRYDIGVDAVTCGRAHGVCDLQQALASSCNCFFAQLSPLIGRDAITEYVRRYGITDSLKFDGITTIAGKYDVQGAADVELAWSSIGQHTIQINPARYLAFVGMIAGGGRGATPYLVKTAGTGYSAKTVLLEQQMDSETAALLQSYMKNNTDTVYGQENFGGLTICAKSGTAEVGEGLTPHALFTGFVADERYPLAFIAVVENSGYGSSVCVPILSKVLQQCVHVMDAR